MEMEIGSGEKRTRKKTRTMVYQKDQGLEQQETGVLVMGWMGQGTSGQSYRSVLARQGAQKWMVLG